MTLQQQLAASLRKILAKRSAQLAGAAGSKFSPASLSAGHSSAYPADCELAFGIARVEKSTTVSGTADC
jgi:hypothetical protein